MFVMEPSCEDPVASPGRMVGRLGVDIGEMRSFKARAMEILRKSGNPARCLQLMRIKAGSILGLGEFLGGGVCYSPEIHLPTQGAMPAIDEGVKSRKDLIETDATALMLAEARLAAPAVDAPEGRFRKASLARPASAETEMLLNLGVTEDSVNLGSDVQGLVQLGTTAGREILQIKTSGLNMNYTEKFRMLKIAQLCFVHGVPMEEEPDPGGIWVLGKLLVQQKGEGQTLASHVLGLKLQLAKEKSICSKVQTMKAQFEANEQDQLAEMQIRNMRRENSAFARRRQGVGQSGDDDDPMTEAASREESRQAQ